MKDISYGNKFRTNILDNNKKLELLSNDDYKTPYDINRMVLNVYYDMFDDNSFLNVLTKELFTNGVIDNNQFSDINITTITLNNPNGTDTVEQTVATINPGIAFQNEKFFIHKPNLKDIENQLSLAINLDVYDKNQYVKFKTNSEHTFFKAKIQRKGLNALNLNTVYTYYFGCSDETEWENETYSLNSTQIIEAIYNHNTKEYNESVSINNLIFDNIGITIENFTLDKYFIYDEFSDNYFCINDNELIMNTTSTGILLYTNETDSREYVEFNIDKSVTLNNTLTISNTEGDNNSLWIE